ncbi:MAG: alpha-ketoacid dehydrogenase subunit beta [Firmicutes bacterium]|nr:alpha-ketoacid dehydrogenase subunit beta [Bacillota bacterium]
MERILNIKDAVNEAISQSMAVDDKVFIMGEDIVGGGGRDHETAEDSQGGAFGVTQGLVKKFGRGRVIDTPISETAFVGLGIGAAHAGLRPIIEIMYVDFVGVCFDQILNQASKLYYMYGGKHSVPMVIRTTVGGGFRVGAEHSQTLYPMFTALPGLKVVTPSNAYDAKGLLIRAIKDNDPVVFLEHKRMYMNECNVPEEPYEIELGKADIKRGGKDVTIVALQKMVEYSLKAAEVLAKEGIDVEVVDPRTISPLDTDTILASARKTGRVVVADESYPRCGMAADFSAIITENLFSELKAPVMRVMPPHTPIPFSAALEDEWIPDVDKIAAMVRECKKYNK